MSENQHTARNELVVRTLRAGGKQSQVYSQATGSQAITRCRQLLWLILDSKTNPPRLLL
jgi:hypothetical protein